MLLTGKNYSLKTIVVSHQWRIQGSGFGGLGPLSLIFDQNENFLGDRPPPPLSQGLDDRPPSEGLDPSFSSFVTVIQEK